jgi:hypothetical protein
MATKKQGAPAAAESRYPNIEQFAEYAQYDDVGALFAGLKEQLSTLKGPKADQAKKVGKAVEKTEELLHFLLQIREKIEAERKGKR